MSATMATPYRETAHFDPPVPAHDRSFFRAFRSAPLDQTVFVAMVCGSIAHALSPRFDGPPSFEVVVAPFVFAAYIAGALFCWVWAALNVRRLREQWLEEAIADERAIAAIERGEVPTLSE